jgi:hypothetical protein
VISGSDPAAQEGFVLLRGIALLLPKSLPVLLLGLQWPVAVTAQAASFDFSNDIAWTAGATLADDEALRRVTLPSTISTLELGVLPAHADLIAYDLHDDGRRLFSLDTFADLGSGVFAGPEDVVAWNGTIKTLYLDGSAAGIPAGTRIDALGHGHTPGVPLTLLSFDVPVTLPGGIHADDEDVVAWSGSVWTLVFDGSASGVLNSLDLDAFAIDEESGLRYFSFDGSGRIGGIDFDDEDVLAFNGTIWSLALDASATLPASFAVGDLDALGVPPDKLFRDGFETVLAP